MSYTAMKVHSKSGPHKSHSLSNSLLSFFFGHSTYLNLTQTAFKSLKIVSLIGSSRVINSG